MLVKAEPIPGVHDLEVRYSVPSEGKIEEMHIPYSGEEFSEYVIYYPNELDEVYPVFVWSNGSGGKISDYGESLKSLADCGFVVIGNDCELTGAGKTDYEISIHYLPCEYYCDIVSLT